MEILLSNCLMLIVGHFIYQFFTKKKYEIALERSWFMSVGVALGFYIWG